MSQAHGHQPAFKNIGSHTFDEFIDMATLFHNYPAPGLLIGGYMVEEARKHMPEGTLYEAISETTWCLPDAIQMLTPCTIGNGWMNVLNLGRYAMSLYDKFTGEGVRVWLDITKIPEDSEILVWLMKEKPKQEQDSDRLRKEIGCYGADILSTIPISVPKPKLIKRSKGSITPCSACGEPYPSAHGALCRACQGESPYAGHTTLSVPSDIVFPVPDALKTVPADTALGKDVVHDMTSILPGTSKGAAFKRGDTFGAGDLCRLQQMGKNNVYVSDAEVGKEWVHEDDCANAFATAMCGTGISTQGEPHEGKVTLVAELDGLLRVNTDAMKRFNMCSGVMAASRNGNTIVRKGTEIGGTRAIPLYLQRLQFEQALHSLQETPLFEVRPLMKARAGLLITGDEVFNGVIEDKFHSIIHKKLLGLGGDIHRSKIVPDNRTAISDAAQEFVQAGCNIIITTAGLSVDPDDVTGQGLLDAGAHNLLYGAPILPGAMTLVGKIGSIPLLGVPACALFFKHTSLDLILPRLLAGIQITREELASMGEGGMCLNCANCSFPKCPFGK